MVKNGVGVTDPRCCHQSAGKHGCYGQCQGRSTGPPQGWFAKKNESQTQLGLLEKWGDAANGWGMMGRFFILLGTVEIYEFNA